MQHIPISALGIGRLLRTSTGLTDRSGKTNQDIEAAGRLWLLWVCGWWVRALKIALFGDERVRITCTEGLRTDGLLNLRYD